MSDQHIGYGMHVVGDVIEPGNVISCPQRDSRPTPTRCTCGSAWFTGDMMFSGDQLLAYSASNVRCVVCNKERPC